MKTFLRPIEDWVAIGIVAILALGICSVAHAEIQEEQAIKAIIGEALPDYDSMYAIACAIRNRGTLQGVYGVSSKQAQHPPSFIYQRANKAWVVSTDDGDVVKGATHWLSDYDIKHCNPLKTAFRFQMQETAYIGQTHFYIERG